MKGTELAIVAEGISKSYNKARPSAGLNGFDLKVAAGTVCALLGPNGAGKTTAIKILTTLIQPDSGKATVAGFDVTRQARQVRQNIGLVGQYAALDELLTARQNLVMFGRLSHLSTKLSQLRAGELLEQFALTDSATLQVSKFSGGMRRRLDLAASLITTPTVLFVDEPTTGLDPLGRREVWQSLRTLVSGGTTLLLTTQYLEEADYLADHIAILREGRIITEGSPDTLKASVGGDWLDITINSEVSLELVAPLVQHLATRPVQFNTTANQLSLAVTDSTSALVTVATTLASSGIVPTDIAIRRPTLEEAFIQLTTSTPQTN